MNFTHEQLRNLGYQPSPDGSTYTRSTTAGLSHAQPQPNPRETLDNAREGENENRPRFGLRITRIACQTLDADNFAGGCKFLIDAIRKRGLIPDDDPASVEIAFRQVKANHKNEEETRVTITYLPGGIRGVF